METSYKLRMLYEQDFRRNTDRAFDSLKRSLIPAEDSVEMEVEDQAGARHISFDEPPGKFIVSPNAPARQIWISALATSFKLHCWEAAQDFMLQKTGEKLKPLLAR